MIKRASLIAALAAVAAPLVVILPSCSKKAADTGWKADVSAIDGVKTVSNPEMPRYGTFTFDLVEDLAIGDEKESYFLPSGATIDVDPAGRIYACDFGNRRIQVYDKEGRYLRTLGRQGQGPGEYTFPSSACVDGAGDVLIDAGRSFVVFGPDGNFKKNIPVKTFLSTKKLGPGGTIIGTTQPDVRAAGGPKRTLVLIGPDGELKRTLAEFPAYGASPGQVLFHWYSGDIAYCGRGADSLYYGFSLEYKAHVVDAEGRPLLSFSKAEEGRGITAQEEDLTRKDGIFAWYGQGDPRQAPLGMPDHRPFFSRFFSDDLGRLYVVRFKPITEKDAPAREVDVFSKDGLYLYRMTWPFVPQIIRGGYLYEVRQDDEAGLTRIIRHRVKNWGDLRAD